MVTPWESTWLSRRTAAKKKKRCKLNFKKKKNTKPSNRPTQPSNRTLDFSHLNLPADCLPGDVSPISFCMKPQSPHEDSGRTHTWAATLRWDWPSNSCVEDLKPFLPPYVSVLHWFKWYFFVCIFIFEYILGRFLLTSGTHWHFCVQDGNLTHPPRFKGRAWRDSDFINDPSRLWPPLLPHQFHPFQRKHVRCCFVFLNFFCSPYLMCFCCRWISVFLFFSVWKWMDLH